MSYLCLGCLGLHLGQVNIESKDTAGDHVDEGVDDVHPQDDQNGVLPRLLLTLLNGQGLGILMSQRGGVSGLNKLHKSGTSLMKFNPFRLLYWEVQSNQASWLGYW